MNRGYRNSVTRVTRESTALMLKSSRISCNEELFCIVEIQSTTDSHSLRVLYLCTLLTRFRKFWIIHEPVLVLFHRIVVVAAVVATH